MILLMQDIEFSVLIAFSIILGYIIGVITQEELEEISKKLYITKIFNYFFMPYFYHIYNNNCFLTCFRGSSQRELRNLRKLLLKQIKIEIKILD
jgi:hypothetical protein